MDRWQLQEALRLAAKSYKLTAIAKELDIPVTAIHQFSSSGSLGDERRDKLEAWLVERGFDRAVKPADLRRTMSVFKKYLTGGIHACILCLELNRERGRKANKQETEP